MFLSQKEILKFSSSTALASPTTASQGVSKWGWISLWLLAQQSSFYLNQKIKNVKLWMLLTTSLWRVKKGWGCLMSLQIKDQGTGLIVATACTEQPNQWVKTLRTLANFLMIITLVSSRTRNILISKDKTMISWKPLSWTSKNRSISSTWIMWPTWPRMFTKRFGGKNMEIWNPMGELSQKWFPSYLSLWTLVKKYPWKKCNF